MAPNTARWIFAEVELKERGIAGAVIQMAEKYHVEERCIIFSGIEDVIWESRTGARIMGNQTGSGWGPISVISGKSRKRCWREGIFMR